MPISRVSQFSARFSRIGIALIVVVSAALVLTMCVMRSER